MKRVVLPLCNLYYVLNQNICCITKKKTYWLKTFVFTYVKYNKLQLFIETLCFIYHFPSKSICWLFSLMKFSTILTTYDIRKLLFCLFIVIYVYIENFRKFFYSYSATVYRANDNFRSFHSEHSQSWRDDCTFAMATQKSYRLPDQRKFNGFCPFF